LQHKVLAHRPGAIPVDKLADLAALKLAEDQSCGNDAM
jgi:hypothetical protein